jgi:aspartyl/asparaginyl-tRNA synthetase
VKNLKIIVNKNVEHFADLLKAEIGSCFQFRGEIIKSPGDKQPIEMKVEKNDTHYVKILISINN